MTNPEEFMSKPKPEPPKSDPIEFWKDSAPGYEHVHMLQTSTFDSIVGASSKALVMFYAPWCGHCKSLKPELMQASIDLHEQGVRKHNEISIKSYSLSLSI